MSRKPVQPKLSIYAYVTEQSRLVDRRLESRGIFFGTVTQVAKQYGVKISKVGNTCKFTAPQMRMQMFIEKLHFSGIRYSSVPPK